MVPATDASGDHEVRQRRPAAHDVDGHGCLAPGGGATDRLAHHQAPGQERVVVRQGSGHAASRRHGHLLTAADDDHRCRGSPAVGGFGDHAFRPGGDRLVGRRSRAGDPGRDDEVRRQGRTVADDVDHDLAVAGGRRASDRFGHGQRAGWLEVRVGRRRRGQRTGLGEDQLLGVVDPADVARVQVDVARRHAGRRRRARVAAAPAPSDRSQICAPLATEEPSANGTCHRRR